ncbi:MAG: NPCBM/NEW2 domain-containing protein [Planctomycetia bacterium]|nr:NPCBM/NEW2 domain-containing protein [Planctomycetia bacterium]
MPPAPLAPRPARRRPPRARLALVATALALVAALRGSPARAAPALVAVEVVPFDGPAVAGPLAEVTATTLRLEGRADPIDLDTVREVRFAGTTAPAATGEGTPVRVGLRGEELIVGRVTAADDVGLEVAVAGLAPLRLVFDLVRRVEADPPGRPPCDQTATRNPPRPNADVAYTRAGDAYAGTLEGASLDGVVLDDGGTKSTVRWADLAILHVDEPALAAPTGRTVEVETRGGTRLPSTTATYDGATWTLATASGLAVKVPAAAAAVVRFGGGRYVHASRLPFEYRHTPPNADEAVPAEYHAPWYAATVDRMVLGCPLRIAGVTYRHGIAVHSKSTVSLPLGKRYARFFGKFGVDDGDETTRETQAPLEHLRGDVTARVLADGREVWSSGGSVKWGQPARVLPPLDVTGVETLVLEVDFGAESDTNDYADWVDVVLERAR